ncbi:MAG: hypothetical protein AUK31_05785 [Fibrobacteres bacterium CG2_30_45_31]|nr:MAG: hypothetical protein AUK31_05785 [Fibrobacteres bacterium CG2_30_45_31]
MHFEILVEDLSGKKMLEILMPKILGNGNTYRIHSYKGCGKIPRNLKTAQDACSRILLEQLPKLLSGYGKTYQFDLSQASIIVVCDLDDRNKEFFLNELRTILDNCHPAPVTRFCLAIEEGEAWLLGDFPAIRQAYPHTKDAVLHKYRNDNICGTWELLADAVYPKGCSRLKRKGYQVIGAEKSRWAEKITPYMDIDKNKSPSFNEMKVKIRELSAK